MSILPTKLLTSCASRTIMTARMKSKAMFLIIFTLAQERLPRDVTTTVIHGVISGDRRDFAKLQDGNGDGMAIDATGRLYVTSAPGVQVFSTEGEYLGTIPTPRNPISVAFSGLDKKILYIVGSGAAGPDGKEFTTPAGVRNNAKTIYKISMQAQGFRGRSK